MGETLSLSMTAMNETAVHNETAEASKAEDSTPIEAQSVPVAEQFSFHCLKEASFSDWESKEVREKLMKWNIDVNSHMVKFRFDQKFERFDAEQFARDFFSDPVVQAHVQVATRHGMARPAGTPSGVRLSKLSTTVTNLDFFDVLKDEDLPCGAIVRDDGKIVGCYEDWEEGVCIQDKLRAAMCKRDSEEWDAIPEHMRKELLFGIFRHVVLGGAMCQWEDNVQPYLATTKLLYKDLVKARKNADNGQIEITTQAYQVNRIDGAGDLFPNAASPNNWCLLLIAPVPRQVTYYYHGIVGFM